MAAVGIVAGLAVFMAGVRVVRSGLDGLAHAGLEPALWFLSGTPLKGIILGAVVTAAIQSSTVTTTLVVTLADCRLISLRQAIPIILGANIGTTMTIQMFALRADRLAPLMIVAGAIIAFAMRRGKAAAIGRLAAGAGLLFGGLGIVSVSTVPLVGNPAFASIGEAFARNPPLGVLGGALLSAALHSSSVAIAMGITACAKGHMALAGGVAVIMGANIGTCATAMMSSVGTTVPARRAAVSHLLFNTGSTALFMVFLGPFVGLIQHTSPSVTGQLANAHTLFNVLGTLAVTPFLNRFAALVERLVPDH